MAKIFEFKKPDGESPHHRKTDSPLALQQKTNHEIFQDMFENVIGDWQKYAVKNKLNKFITSKLPATAVGADGADYVNDLNAISAAEQKLGMMIAVFCPGATHTNLHGWVAAFHRGKEIFSTPADMASEASARSLNIVLFVVFTATLKTLGRD
jgi:hypothetical protein